MTTPLTKPVSRLSHVKVREVGEERPLVVTLYPSGFIGLRPQGTRREETLSLDVIYDIALKARVRKERA